MDQKRRETGHNVKVVGKYHMIFQGNPGTGKTSLARIVAQLLHRIGIIKSEILVEVQRDKLVAEYVGQTGPKTQKVIDQAKQGVLFIDEAYRLSQDSGKSDFGREAIEQLMAAMNDPPGKAPIMVFAGYADDMDTFMQANSGLYRRIGYTFDFSDYSPFELAEILNSIVTSFGFKLAQPLTVNNFSRVAAIIENNTLPQAREMMNGGLCERLFDFAKQSLDAREAMVSASNPSMEVTEGDLLEACRRIPPPPVREGRESSAASADTAGLAQKLQRSDAKLRCAQAEIHRLQAQLRAVKAARNAWNSGDLEGRGPRFCQRILNFFHVLWAACVLCAASLLRGAIYFCCCRCVRKEEFTTPIIWISPADGGKPGPAPMSP
eukprot:Skav231034  [mRNA]  locus=scaffold1869:260877:262010:- [translate_table: standard]